jgi:parallel beta-helix repeat protein
VVRRRALASAVGIIVVWAMGASSASAAPVSCGEVITDDTTLESDLSCSGEFPADGIIIGAPGITLDLGGHRVYADRFPILNEGHDDFTVRNGSVAGGEYGSSIHIVGADRNQIEDMVVEGFQAGVFLVDSERARVVSSEFRDVGVIAADGSNQTTVRGNSLRGREAFITAADSSHNRIRANEITGTDGPPIGLSNSNGNLIARNTTVSDFEGITLRASDNNEVVHNVGRREEGVDVFASRGVELHDSSRNRVRHNLFFGKRVGVWVTSGEGNRFTLNRALEGTASEFGDLEPDGFRIEAAASGTVLRGNTAARNPDDGIDVESPSTSLLDNAATDNGDFGIEAVPGVFAVGNRASGNGNPLRCLNIVCQ